jgi:hypothetical protein
LGFAGRIIMAFLEPKMDDINEEFLADAIRRCTVLYGNMRPDEKGDMKIPTEDFRDLLYAACQWRSEKWKVRAYDQIRHFVEERGNHGKPKDVKENLGRR